MSTIEEAWEAVEDWSLSVGTLDAARALALAVKEATLEEVNDILVDESCEVRNVVLPGMDQRIAALGHKEAAPG